MHKGCPLANSRTKTVIILEGQIGIGGNRFRHKIFEEAEANDNRRTHCTKGNRHRVEHQTHYGSGHSGEAQCQQQGCGKSSRSTKTRSTFDKGTKHKANDDRLKAAVTAHALHTALNGLHATAFLKSVEDKDGTKNDNQNTNCHNHTLQRQGKQIGGRQLPAHKPADYAHQPGQGHGSGGRPSQTNHEYKCNKNGDNSKKCQHSNRHDTSAVAK